MFEKEIQTAKQQLSSHLLTGDTYVYLQDILNNPEVHSFYKGFFRGEVDWWIYEQKMLREASPRFDFGDKEFLGIQQEYDGHCRRTARFDHVELTSMIDLAAKTRVNYLLRPRTTLKWFVYRGEPTKPLHEVLLRFAYFDCYNYLLEEFGKWAAGKLAEASHQDILSVIEFERLIENIDNDIILEHTTSEFAELLSPLYQFFYEVQSKGHQHTIPTPALIIFLDDKGILRISQELERLMKEEDFTVITRQEFLNVIDNVILQVEEETGVPQIFVDDSTIPLDFDHSARRQITPMQKPVEVAAPTEKANSAEQTAASEEKQELQPVLFVTEQKMPEQIDGAEKDADEPKQADEPVADIHVDEEESDHTDISDRKLLQPESEKVPVSIDEPEANPDSESAVISIEEVSDALVDIVADTSEAAEPVSIDEEVAAEEPFSGETVVSPAEPDVAVEEFLTIVDVTEDEEQLAVDDIGLEEGEAFSLAISDDDETVDGKAQDVDPMTAEEEADVLLPESGDGKAEQSPDTESQEEQSDEGEPEYVDETLSLVDAVSEAELHDMALPEPEHAQPTYPDTSDAVEDPAPDEQAAYVVADFPDEDPEEYELYDTGNTDENTSDYPVDEKRIGIWKTAKEESQKPDRSEEELYNALFPDTIGKNVQSDAVPSVDAGQHEPDVINQEEVLLEQTDNDTSGTSATNGIHYSAIEELLDDNLRQKVVKHVFHRNEERFQAVLKRLNATRSWRDASSIIDRVFSEHEVDPYSSIARKFSDIVYERFLTGQ